jgi:uncharacterized protein
MGMTIYKGKTVEEALEAAEIDTGKKRSEFIYEVTEEKVGFIKHTEYIVNIKGYKQRGKVEIKEGQLIYYKGDILPSISPSENVIIRVNGISMTGKTYIKEDDKVQFTFDTSEPERTIKLEKSEDQYSAYIEIEYKPQRTYQVMDKEPSSDITIEGKVVKEIYPKKFEKKDIENLLLENKIKYGIQWINVEKALNGERVAIALGKEPEEPVEDQIKYFFSQNSEKRPVEIDGKVDYHSIGQIEFVVKGKILAITNEGSDGKPGVNIYGNVVPCKARKKVKLLSGPGCEIVDNGKKAIASANGMPSIKDDRICVYPVHMVRGDVSIKTGNIEFDGDIVVEGNVKEGMKVVAGNNITINGDAADSTLISTGNIKISKNVIACDLKAGNKQFVDVEAVKYLGIMRGLFNNLLSTYQDLIKTGKLQANMSSGLLFKIMLQTKYNQEKDKVADGAAFLSKNKINEEILKRWDDSFKIYKLIEDGSLVDVNSLLTYYKSLSDFITKHEISQTPADIIINYAQNSSLYASNNVEVKGKGCYNTNIVAENKVIFSGSPGVFRGGQIIANKAVMMKEVGSTAGVLTVIRTSKEGIVEAKTAYQNTVIFIGEQAYKIEYPVKMLKAYMDRGEMKVEKLKL